MVLYNNFLQSLDLDKIESCKNFSSQDILKHSVFSLTALILNKAYSFQNSSKYFFLKSFKHSTISFCEIYEVLK